MTNSIRKRLDALQAMVGMKDLSVTIELPDGSLAKKGAADWWDHRREWPLADFDRQNNSGGLVVFLVLAALADDCAAEARAKGDMQEVQRLEEEREYMLSLYFGGDR